MTQPKPLVHSFSSLEYFANCSHKYAEVKVFKRFHDKPFKASEEGVALHQAFENAISMGTLLPDGLIKHTATVDMLKGLPGQKFCEIKMGLTRRATPCDFWDKDAWIRGAADFINIQGDHAIIVDYKDGSPKSPKPAQLHCMATMVFRKFPQVKTCRGVLMFVNHEVLHTENFGRENFDQMFNYWAERMTKVEKAIATNTYSVNPSGLCRGYCPVSSCPHWEEKPRAKT